MMDNNITRFDMNTLHKQFYICVSLYCINSHSGDNRRVYEWSQWCRTDLFYLFPLSPKFNP
jgi:hypothetical protein